MRILVLLSLLVLISMPLEGCKRRAVRIGQPPTPVSADDVQRLSGDWALSPGPGQRPPIQSIRIGGSGDQIQATPSGGQYTVEEAVRVRPGEEPEFVRVTGTLDAGGRKYQLILEFPEEGEGRARGTELERGEDFAATLQKR